jgi:hypothetical protein
MTIGQLAAIRARIAGRLEPHIDVTEIAMAVADLRLLLDEVDRLNEALEEKEGDMHLRIRRGYDKTVSDAWKAWAAKIEKERDEARSERDAAFHRGANAMREAAAQALSTQGNGYYGLTGSGVAKTIRNLPIPEDKS